LRQAEDGREVDLDDRRPVLLRKVHGGRAADDAGVVDEDVEPSELVQRPLDQAARHIFVREVADDRERAPAGVHDRPANRLGAARVAVTGHVGAGLRERDRDGRAQARRGARHERDLAVQPEGVEYHLGFFSACKCVRGKYKRSRAGA
jgi:hypothetical protein